MSLKRGRPKDIPYVYKDADKYFVFNDGDPELDEVKISLPSPPEYYLIDGYGLAPEDQYFRRLKIPDKLKDIERDARRKMRDNEKSNKNFIVTSQKLIHSFWESFNIAREHGYDEVSEYLKEVNWMRIHGYWFFNDGKPTYITGDHFDYLNYWTFMDEKSNDSGYPEYRDIDRIVYLSRKYAETTTESVWKDDNGDVHVKEWGVRLCFGTAEPKSRRCGITTQAIHQGAKMCMTSFGKYSTIVSMEGDNAEAHYKKKYLPAFQDYPIWLKPIHGNQIGKSTVFSTPNAMGDENYLNSVYDYTDSAGESKNDGDKLHFGLFDEEGKTLVASISERWNVNKQAMSKGGGSDIIGFSIHPTTVEEMDVGGQEYMKLCNQSKFYERGKDGQTISGLFEIFVPAWKRMEGFVDRFGVSVTDKPTERQIRLRPDAKFSVFGVGAKEYLQTRLDELLEIGTPDALETHRSIRRKYPMRYADCWLGSSGDLGFDMEILDKRLADLRRESKVRLGRFEWVDGFGGNVRFVNDPSGPFEVSLMMDKEANQKIKIDEFDFVTGQPVRHWAPLNPYRFTASADPFKSGTSNEAKQMGRRTRQSDGGLAVFWEYDESVDADKETSYSWESHRFVCSYRYRPPSLPDYQEDALKMCIYYGASFYPETNVGDMDVYFKESGFGGYLLYDINPINGKRAEKAGFASYEKKKGQLFVATKDYIRHHGHREQHASYFEECKAIKGTEQMNRYDRFTAHGGCLLGSQQNKYNRARHQHNRPSMDRVKQVLSFFDQNF